MEFTKIDNDSIIGNYLADDGKIFHIQANINGRFLVEEISEPQRGLPNAEEIWSIYHSVIQKLQEIWSEA